MSPNLNSLGRALALAGLCDQPAAARRPAAWQTRQPTRRERWVRVLDDEQCRLGHRLSHEEAHRKRRK